MAITVMENGGKSEALVAMHRKAVEMKPEEAIKRLKHEILFIETSYKMSDSKRRAYCAMKMAIDALEKQMPKKPAIKTGTFAITVDGNELVRYTAHCPNCGIRILFPRQKEGNYCDYCGQKFDWSEVE